MDVLEKRMGIGVFIKKTELNHLVDSYVISALLDTKVSRELLDFRLMLEVETAGKAAEMVSDEELVMMEEALRMHREAIKYNKPTVESDELFHKAIFLAARNSVLLKVYDFLSDLLNSFKQDLLKVENKTASLEYHLKIYQAIKEYNGEEARAAMREHLLDVTSRFNTLQKEKESSVKTESTT